MVLPGPRKQRLASLFGVADGSAYGPLAKLYCLLLRCQRHTHKRVLQRIVGNTEITLKQLEEMVDDCVN